MPKLSLKKQLEQSKKAAFIDSDESTDEEIEIKPEPVKKQNSKKKVQNLTELMRTIEELRAENEKLKNKPLEAAEFDPGQIQNKTPAPVLPPVSLPISIPPPPKNKIDMMLEASKRAQIKF